MRPFSTIGMFRCILLTVHLLLNASFGVIASNLDSEIAQDSSSPNQDSQKNAPLMQGNDKQWHDASSVPISNEPQPGVYDQPHSTPPPAISPIRTGTFVTREVIRQVLPFGFVSVERQDRVTINGRSMLSNDRPAANSMFGSRFSPSNFMQPGTRWSTYGIRHQNRVPYGQPPQQPISSHPTTDNQRPGNNVGNHNSPQVPQSISDSRTSSGTINVNEWSTFGIRNQNRVSDGQPPQQPPISSRPTLDNQRPGNNEGNPNSPQVPQSTSDSRISSGTVNVNPSRDVRPARPARPSRRPSYRPFISNFNPPSDRQSAGNQAAYIPPRAPPPDQKINRRIPLDLNLYSGIVNDFAFKLVDTMNMESNFVVSPISVFIALSMCYLGSGGSTKAQLENFLGLDKYSVHEERLHQGIRDLVQAIIPRSNQEYQLFIANAMFLGRNFVMNPDFVSSIQRLYAAELKNLDFSNPQFSVPDINDWVSRATRNTITKISDNPPSTMTSLLLLNAIYFKGIWKKQFPTNMTYVGRFFTPSGQDKMVPTMPLYDESFPMYRSDDHRHTFIKLPYQGDQISMIIALPFTFRDRPMPSNTDKILCEVRDSLKDTVMDTVTVPKFKMEFTASLKNPLTRLGITHLFNRNTVNLNRLTSANDIVVSEILHKAVVEVNEQGTTASASTAVKFVPLAYKNTTDFIVNHPFAYYIIHEPSGLVLFYGKVYDIGVDPASGD